jgi:hypothetical protein
MAGVVAGIDLGGRDCAIECDKRWMMRASWLRLSTRREGACVERAEGGERWSG